MNDQHPSPAASVETPPGVADLARAVAAGATTARAVVDDAIRRLEATRGLNAVTVLLADRARAEADARDRALAEGAPAGPLHGVPVAVKEEVHVEGCVTTCGGSGNSTPAAQDAEIVRRLRAAGAVVVARAAMPELGAWPFTESVATGTTRNPWDHARTPGGSSGGSAAVLAAGAVPAAIGGDGGGSIRIPSACCGLFGLKPQRGRVTVAPDPHLWWALGTTGPLARSVLDAALVYDAIRGGMPTDRFSAGPVGSFAAAARREPGRLRVGWSTRPVTRGVRPDPVTVRAVEETARLLADLGHDVAEIDPRYPDPTLAFVPQFLGGLRCQADAVEHRTRLERRTRATCRLGAWVTPGVIDRALAATETVSRRANRVFDRVDVLLTPTIAPRPPRVGRLDGVGPLRAALRAMPMIAYCALWNVAGNPAAAVPAGTGPDGLPTSVQLVGPTDGEELLLSLSAQLEAARPWPLVAPDRSGR